MKYLKKYTKFKNFKESIYNTYNTTATHNIKPIYNDNVDISELVQNTINYINDNYDSISDITDINSNYPSIEFSTYQNVKKILIHWDSKIPIPKLQFVINKKISPESKEYQSYPITMKEYDYLKDFFIETKRRKDMDNTKDYDAADLINPLKVAASKYNL